ncbi:MAG: hypothetical protein A2W93_03615 [Bacteroidetes bacterium GWF2_43_63]|nr:MAG: hypothetical protein A2W93_03615 [Bacteroidetes bacterium GWF2_43_63]HBG70515.1 hypothetical protein [Bacteroidales bacterium]HCB61510.1 hypothetical protein [Bacteroidales bacterium]
MIPDNKTNTLYLADSLPIKVEAFYEKLEVLLKRHGVVLQFLSPTKDIWARDYMPVQVSADRFVQFTYNPDYLRRKQKQKSISDVEKILQNIPISVEKSDLIVDGGNIVHSSDKVFMCDKVFKENPNYSRDELENKLCRLLEVERIFFLPTHPKDMFGHADGLVRFADEATIIVNNNVREDSGYKDAFNKAIHSSGLNTIEIPYNPYGNRTNLQANGIYINYLQIENLILLPAYNIDEDKTAMYIFEEIFKDCTIKQLDCNDIADDGGVLNCISWTALMEGKTAESEMGV